MTTDEKKKPGQSLSAWCGLALALTASGLTVLFSVSNGWVRRRVLATVALYALSLLLFEFANTGRWFPQFSTSQHTSRGLVRVLAGISGLALLLIAFGLCLALGAGKWNVTSAGFLFGMFSTSLLFIRSSITGKSLPESK